MTEYGIAIEQLAEGAHPAVLAAERSGAHTLVFRGSQAVAAIVPMRTLIDRDGALATTDGTDPLLSLCGTCGADAFVDALTLELANEVARAGGLAMRLDCDDGATSRKKR
ncbi:MAG: hypothetical protein EXR75_03585 [Myxococcales bacterium]|nr:hypothetical protein [Myxococcales bacterium]